MSAFQRRYTEIDYMGEWVTRGRNVWCLQWTETLQGAHLMVCNRSSQLLGNPKLAWHPARFIKEWGCVDLSMDILHLTYPLVLFGSEGSALFLPLFRLSPRIIILCLCSSTMIKDHFLPIAYGTKWPLCVDLPLNTYSFIHSE